MSGFMFGGSALTLDIGVRNNTVQPVIAGDVLQVDLTQAAVGELSTSDGYDAVHCSVGTNEIGHYSVTGVVLAPEGREIGPQEECIIRVMGMVEVQATAGASYTTGQLLTPTAVTPSASTPVRFTVAASAAVDVSSNLTRADISAKAVCLQTVTAPSGVSKIKAWMKGLPL